MSGEAATGGTSYAIEYAKSGRSTCKESKEKIEKGELRIAKMVSMPRGDEIAEVPTWHKVVPFFVMMARMRKKENHLKAAEDMAGWDEINEEDQDRVRQHLSDFHDPDVDFPPKPEKKKKRETKEDDEEEEEPQQQKKKKKKEELAEVPDETRENVGNEDVRALAEELVKRCRERGLNVPDDDDAARKKMGPIVMSHRQGTTVDVAAVIRFCDGEFGQKVTVDCECAANVGLASAFKELASFEFKRNDRFKGSAYQKVSTAIAEHAVPITDGKQATKLPGIGKSSAAKIDEFLASGTIAKLEEYRNGA
mmetsp:Transcript_22693/g.69759  ORF Transcript_22693/g.69759 Transcript_22693/m.69759 type:complete len:308 (-) Transcript_22693:330-1253(-)